VPCSTLGSGVRYGLIPGTGVYLGIQAPPRDASVSCGSHRNHLSRVTSDSCVLQRIMTASRASWSKGSAAADNIRKHTACQYPEHSAGGAQQGRADRVEARVEKTYGAQSRRNVGPSPLGGDTCSPGRVVTRTFSDERTDGRTDGRSDDGRGGVRDLDAL
jgi:hypothetical protein